MPAAWRAAGFTFNKYLSITSRAVRRTLKEEPRLAAEKRGQLDVKFSKWTNGKQGETHNLSKNVETHA